MTMTPPRMATWLLHRWGPAYRRESLIGDLAEAYAGPRQSSAMWYWGEVLTAIAAGIVAEARAHPWLIARGVAAGHLLLAALGALAWTIWNLLAVGVWNWTVTHEWDVVRSLLWGSGFIPPLAAQAFGALTVGWLVVRSHPVVAPAAVSLTAASVAIVRVAIGVWTFGPTGYLDTLLVYPIHSLGVSVVVVGLLVGGLIGSSAIRPDHAIR